MVARIPIDRQAIAAFCRRHHIRRLSLFGSALRDDFDEDSDVDLLYVFDPEYVPGWEIVDIAEELERMLGRRVDLVPEKFLNRWVREDIMQSTEVLYDEG
ncbi:MAG: nucleotidyltransferase domain-containing protein [Phycisphaeraceae bacterium]